MAIHDPRDLRVTYGSDNLGWIVFDAAARDAHPRRVIYPLFAVGPRPPYSRGLARGCMRGSAEAKAWLHRQRYGAPVGKLRARKPDSIGGWYVEDEAGTCYAIASTAAEARDCIRLVLANPPAEPVFAP